MKNLLSFLAVSIFVLCLSSCTKSGTCTCDLGIFGIQTDDFSELDSSEYDAAKSSCEARDECTWKDN